MRKDLLRRRPLCVVKSLKSSKGYVLVKHCACAAYTTLVTGGSMTMRESEGG